MDVTIQNTDLQVIAFELREIRKILREIASKMR